MGVQGLSRLLEDGGRPRVVSLQDGEAANRTDKLLLVDASTVQYHLMEKLYDHHLDWRDPATFHARLYAAACRYYGGLQRAGLKLRLVLDSAPPPGAEATYTDRRRRALAAGRFMPPTAEPVLLQAYADLGLEVVRSVHGADPLVLALALAASATGELFALLTNDSDFYVFAVPRVIHAGEVVVDPRSVTLHVWNTEELWRTWQASATMAGAAAARPAAPRPGGPGGRGAGGGWGRGPAPGAGGGGGGAAMAAAGMPSLLRRAQVAAVLGNDVSKELRRRLDVRRGNKGGGGAAFVAAAGAAGKLRAVASPSVVARVVLQLPPPRQGEMLSLDFFRSPPVSLKGFKEDDLAEFNGVVQSYMDEHAAARDGSALQALTLTPALLPWLHPAVATRLASAVPLPALLASLACRGVASLAAPPPHWRQVQALRRSVAAALLTGGGSAAAAPGGGSAYEYDANNNTLHVLVSAAADAADGSDVVGAVEWFDPATHLPGVAVRDAPEAAAASANGDGNGAVQRQPTLVATAAAVAAAQPGLPPSLAVYYALLMHAVDPDAGAWDAGAVRELLLPGVAMGRAAVVAADAAAAANGGADGDGEDEEEEGARQRAGATVVDVGSALTAEDWEDIDSKEVVNKLRASPAFALMGRITPWAPAPPPQMAAAGSGGGGGAGSAVAVSVSSSGPEAGKQLMALARQALAAGTDSPLWAAMQKAWSSAKPAARAQALSDMWASTNRASPIASSSAPSSSSSSAPAGPVPTRHRHQQELLDLVDEHLTESATAARGRPLAVILSTPTGSGKTFTAVMMQLHVLREAGAGAPTVVGAGSGAGGRLAPDAGVAVEGRQGHPGTILVYSVPTKQVLKRVGQECEAHNVVYWTAASEGELFQVRRPYSIRTKKGGGSTGTGTMAKQLEACGSKGAEFNDRGGGRPHVIIADIRATAALVRAARDAAVDAFYHWSHLLLYFDEPNMGIHLDPQLRAVVRDVMASAPLTTILASATLPAWDDLPAWWKGGGAASAPTTRVVITQEPYELPMSRLTVLDEVTGQLVPLSPLQLFEDATEMAASLEASPRGRVLLLRHFAPQQANELLAIGAGAGGGGAAAAAAGGEEAKAEAQDGSEEGGESEEWEVLAQDVRSLRSELLEPELLRLAGQPERFAQLRSAWTQRPQLAAGGIRDVLSKQGVTMVATLQPRAVALLLAGKAADPTGWAEEAKALRLAVREAAAAKRAAIKARDRAAKRGAGEEEGGGRAGGRDDGLSGAGRVDLRVGIKVDSEEAEGVQDDDTLVMLARGVAYTGSRFVEPLVKSLYQQALLFVPERAGTRPPIHTLVVDYSAVYGTDAPAVDTLVLCPDLGARLSWQDHQQFFGRLRRDGTVVYPSFDMLRAAVLGGSGRAVGVRRAAREEEMRRRVEGVLAKYVAGGAEGGADATAAAAKELAALVRPGVYNRSEIGCAVLAAALTNLLAPAAPFVEEGDSGAAAVAAAAALAAGSDKEVLAAALRRLKSWGALKPMELLLALKLLRPAEQRRLVETFERLCCTLVSPAAPSGDAAAVAGNGNAAAAVEKPGRLLPCAARLLQEMADEEVVEEEGLQEWIDTAAVPRVGGATGVSVVAADAAAQFRKAAGRVLMYLQESSDESEEGEE